MSRVVDQMVAAGLVERQSDPNDLRALSATITAAGRKALRGAAPVYLRGTHKHFTGP